MDSYLKQTEIYLTSLKPNWDDEGAKPISPSTWERAKLFIIRMHSMHSFLPKPDISPCPDGSIDVYWNNGVSELLANVPSEEQYGTFFSQVLRTTRRISGTYLPEESVPMYYFWYSK